MRWLTALPIRCIWVVIFEFQITHLILSSVGLSSRLFSSFPPPVPLCFKGFLTVEGSGLSLFFLAVVAWC